MKNLLLTICGLFLWFNTFSQTWSPVGNGVNGTVYSFAVYNNELYIGGDFKDPGGFRIGLLKWNGISFDSLPGSYLFGEFQSNALCVFNNELYVGLYYNQSSFPTIYNNIAKWNGTLWDTVGNGLNGLNNHILVMKVYNDNLYAAGTMDIPGVSPIEKIAKWNGIEWLGLGNDFIPSGGNISELAVFNNELYAAGGFFYQAINSDNIAIWNDTIWRNTGPGGVNAHIHSINTYNNNLIAGGLGFTQAGGSAVNGVASWDGTNWSPFGNAIGNQYGQLLASLEYQNDFYVGGDFNILDGASINSIARYTNGAWVSMGTGVDSTNIAIDSLITPFDTTYFYPPHSIHAFQEFNGELYVGGEFNMIGGITAHSVAKWTVPVGLSEFNGKKSLNIYPNPVSNRINIEYHSNSLINSIEIFNSEGQLVFYDPVFNFNAIDASGLPNGIYLLRCSNNDNSLQKIFVVNH